MAEGPAEAFKAISRYLRIDHPPVLVRDLLLMVIEGEGWQSGDEAAARAERWKNPFLVRIEKAIRDDDDLGWVYPFAFNSSSGEYIQGSCYCEPSDEDRVKTEKQNRANTFIIREYLSQLSARDFEILCKRILTFLGVLDPHASRSSADEGVDFYGVAPFGRILRPRALPLGSEKQLNVWYIGQAKQYDETSVSTDELRDLIGATAMARSKVFASSTDPLSHFKARLCDPIISLIVTTGRFTRDSVSLLKSAGIMGMDGLQLSQFLADNEAGIINGVFSEPAFDTWLRMN